MRGWQLRFNFSEYSDLEAVLADLRAQGYACSKCGCKELDLEDVFTDIMKRA